MNKYLDYIKRLQENKYQMIYLYVNADDGLDSNDINEFITYYYHKLSNYHNAVITFEDGKRKDIEWTTIAKVAVYMENFLTEKNFHAFNKRNKPKRIHDVLAFLKNNKYLNNNHLEDLIGQFYSGVSYGFQFIDLFISNDGHKKTLVMQKIKLDNTARKCPVCLHDKVRGNSYSKLLMKSFECDNPKCPARSKGGRGKRFDMLGAKRQIMLRRKNPNDVISKGQRQAVRRDIVNKSTMTLDTFIKLYTWYDDSVLTSNSSCLHHDGTNDLFSSLPIVKFLKGIYKNIRYKQHSTTAEKINKSIIARDNSSNIGNYSINIGSAITSPPYYNAREYSQWNNFLCYLVDMMINAKAVYDKLHDGSYYIYNVGDIVGKDYVFVKSNMSTCRLMLGFYSALLFDIVGYDLVGNIIWDKGEVQSKRHSSPNHYAGYVKPINSYEHNLIFKKRATVHEQYTNY